MMNRGLYLKLRTNSILAEIRKIEEFLSWFENGPAGIFSAWPDGSTRRTNEPEAALMQREDLNEKIDRLEELYTELDQIGKEARYGAA